MSGNGAQRWFEWGGNGPLLHFGHGNGFPPGTYRALVTPLCRQFEVISMAARPLWSDTTASSLRSWSELADDLRQGLAARGLRGLIGVGHSLGAALTMQAAVADPGLFTALVLIDPLLLTGPVVIGWRLMRCFGLAGLLPLVKVARRRRVWWPDQQVAHRVLGGKAVFAGWQAEVLDDYLAHGLAEMNDGTDGNDGNDGSNSRLELRYPREWEARIFETSPASLWPVVRRLTMPVLFVRGEHSDTFSAAAVNKIRRCCPFAEVITVPGTSHFVPMERPDEVARIALDFLQR